MIVGCIICEIVLLGITAVRTACTIASEFGYRLYPLNQERYFVATALIRACFGMLHSLCRKCASIVSYLHLPRLDNHFSQRYVNTFAFCPFVVMLSFYKLIYNMLHAFRARQP